MKKTNTISLGLMLLFIFVVAFNTTIVAQTPNVNIPYSYQFYQKLNTSVYDVNTRTHSSIKGFYADDPKLKDRYQYLINQGTDSVNHRSWLRRKITEEHLLHAKGDGYAVYADFLPDFQIGRDFANNQNTWLNTRGYQIGGTVGSQFSLYTNGFENQAVFPGYVTDFINANGIVPSEMTGKLTNKVKDWSYVTALLSFTPNKHLNLSLGYDKNFIGDGYRSMLLSDVAANYSFLRVRATLGNVQYQTIFAYMLDPGAERLTTDRRLGDRGKWMAAHYIDWNATNRFSIGFFQAVTWADAEAEGKRSFDFNYVHPFIFLRPVESANTTSPDKMRLGLNAKYEILNNTTLYGQFMLDEFTAKEIFSGKGYWANKYAVQLGFKGANLFRISGFNYLAEFNSARPYTYAHFSRISNYGAMNQPLAHPFGANFKEVLGILNYSYKRFDFQGQGIYATYGLDTDGLNYGKDIFKSYNTIVASYGNKIGQGLTTDLLFTEVKVAYLLNPRYNLRIEFGGVLRRESNDSFTKNTTYFNFGLRSSFRNLYQDF